MKRKVRIETGLPQEYKAPILILTDAPSDMITQMVSTFAIDEALEFIGEEHYLRHLYDPESDPVDDIDAIGWDEHYDECGNRLVDQFLIERYTKHIRRVEGKKYGKF